jgi:hypothetical protein
MWPEFDESRFDVAIDKFTRRERRFGAVPEPARLETAPA